MDWLSISQVILYIQKGTSIAGILIIFSGILLAVSQYLYYLVTGKIMTEGATINSIRLNLGRILVLGLEFIVAADLISTTTTPDYYTLGMVASIVLIRTLLNFTLNRDLISLSK